MRAPTSPHRYICACRRRIVLIVGDGTWWPWSEFERLAEEHAARCPRAAEPWTLGVLARAPDDAEP